MKQGQKTLVCALVAGVGACALAAATTADSANPYQKIVERNVFALKPPPPPPDPEANKPPLPKITLTGITTMFGKPRALLKTPPPPVKPGETPKGEQFYMIALGDRDGDMEVLEIDEKAGAVKVRFAGTEVPLNFVDNGAKPISAPGPMPGGIPGQPGAIPPPPPGFPSAQPTIPGAKPLPTRTLRLPTPGSAPAGPAGYQGYAPPVGGGYVNPSVQVATPGGTVALPSFNMSTPTPAPAQPVQKAEPEITPEQQMILMEVQREQNRHNPVFPPLPPTPLTPQKPQ